MLRVSYGCNDIAFDGRALPDNVSGSITSQAFNVFEQPDHAHRCYGNVHFGRGDAMHELVSYI
jgi:hypothetical protein